MIRSLSIDKVIRDSLRQDGIDPFDVVDDAMRGDGRFSIGLGPSAHIRKLTVGLDVPRMDGAVQASGSHAFFSRMMARLVHGDDVRLLYCQAHSLNDGDPAMEKNEATLELRYSDLNLAMLPSEGRRIYDFLKVPILKRGGRVLESYPMPGNEKAGYRASMHILIEPAWETLKR